VPNLSTLTNVDGIEYRLVESAVIVIPDGVIEPDGTIDGNWGRGEGGPLYWLKIVHVIGTPPFAVPEQPEE